MEYYYEKPKNTPIAGKYEVIVSGGGPAGFGAALYAARRGAGVLLVEQSGELGGVATSGLMSHWTGATKGGLFEELVQKAELLLTPLDLDYFPLINHVHLQNVMTDMLLEAGVHIRKYTMAVEPIMRGNAIAGVIIESKSGREAVLADILVDCTGDGDIAARAGASCFKGRENDGKMQPMTLMIQFAGVDRKKVSYLTEFGMDWKLPQGPIQALARQKLPFPAGHVLIYPSVYPDNVILNMTNCIDVDGTDAKDLNRADIACRKQINVILDFFRDAVPGFENAYVIKTASQIGVRETRHFHGLETITEADILEGRVFDNWAVTKAHFNFDVHNLSGPGLDESGSQLDFPQPKGYTIPYGCFVPLKIDNLLLAGRCISGTHKAHSNFRVMPICVNMGQAVGIAAAMCAKGRVLPRNLNIHDLQSQLKEYGVMP